MRPLLTLPLLVVLAGCTGLIEAGEKTQESADGMQEAADGMADAMQEMERASEQAEPSSSGSSPQNQTTATEGTTVTATNATADVNETAPAAPPAPYTVPVDVEGRLGTGVSQCERTDGGTTCVFGNPDGEPTSHDPEIEDPLVSFSLTLTWTAASPISENLLLVVETCDQSQCDRIEASGPSPLTLSVPDAKGRGNPLVMVRTPDLEDGAWIDDGTPFRLEGAFVAIKVPGHDGFASPMGMG